MGVDRMGAGTAAAYELIREHIPFLVEDVVLAPHIEMARKLVAGGTIKRAVENELGLR
jgi:histidine ammonia-lyase